MKSLYRVHAAQNTLADAVSNSGLKFTPKPVIINGESYHTLVGCRIFEKGRKVGCFRHMGRGYGFTLEIDPMLLSQGTLLNLMTALRAGHS